MSDSKIEYQIRTQDGECTRYPTLFGEGGAFEISKDINYDEFMKLSWADGKTDYRFIRKKKKDLFAGSSENKLIYLSNQRYKNNIANLVSERKAGKLNDEQFLKKIDEIKDEYTTAGPEQEFWVYQSMMPDVRLFDLDLSSLKKMAEEKKMFFDEEMETAYEYIDSNIGEIRGILYDPLKENPKAKLDRESRDYIRLFKDEKTLVNISSETSEDGIKIPIVKAIYTLVERLQRLSSLIDIFTEEEFRENFKSRT